MKPSQYVEAIVGKRNLNVKDEIGSVTHKVWTIIVHPDWDPTIFSFDADLALVVLKEPVALLKNVIQLINLSRMSEKLSGEGTVVAFERSAEIGYDYENTPSMIELPVVSQSECFEASKDLQATASNRIFCAGYFYQSKDFCVGDSGSGFYRFDEVNRHYELAGIVSASVRDPYRLCKIHTYSIFTDIAKFTRWIDQNMEQTKEIIWKNVNFYCNLHPRS